jgi:hypothetical protein
MTHTDRKILPQWSPLKQISYLEHITYTRSEKDSKKKFQEKAEVIAE